MEKIIHVLPAKMLFILLVVIVILVSLYVFYLEQNPHSSLPNRYPNFPTPISTTANVQSTFPKNNSVDNSISTTSTIVFSRSLLPYEQQQVHVFFIPTLTGNIQWADAKTLLFQPLNPLEPNQIYEASVVYSNYKFTWKFSTVIRDHLSVHDQQILQSQADRAYGNKEKSIDNSYPWYNSFPLATTTYFVYFDLQSKTFKADLHPHTPSSISIDTQVATIKQDIIAKLMSLGIDNTKYLISWDVNPRD